MSPTPKTRTSPADTQGKGQGEGRYEESGGNQRYRLQQEIDGGVERENKLPSNVFQSRPVGGRQLELKRATLRLAVPVVETFFL